MAEIKMAVELWVHDTEPPLEITVFSITGERIPHDVLELLMGDFTSGDNWNDDELAKIEREWVVMALVEFSRFRFDGHLSWQVLETLRLPIPDSMTKVTGGE